MNEPDDPGFDADATRKYFTAVESGLVPISLRMLGQA